MSALRQGLRGLPAASSATAIRAAAATCASSSPAYLARARGVRADPELVVVCAGFRHGLSLVARALRAAGARPIAMEDPCAEQHRAVVAAAGLRDRAACRSTSAGRAPTCSTTAWRARCSRPAHQFPLGVVLHRDRRAAAVAWATATGGLVVEDDYDGEFRYDRQPVGRAAGARARSRRLRRHVEQDARARAAAGWIVVPPRLLEPIVSLRSAEDVHVPALEQVALCQMLALGRVRAARAPHARALPRAPRPRARDARRAARPRSCRSASPPGSAWCSSCPRAGRAAHELIEEAARRSIALYPLALVRMPVARPRATAIVLGYGALPEHEVEAGLSALGGLLAELIPA